MTQKHAKEISLGLAYLYKHDEKTISKMRVISDVEVQLDLEEIPLKNERWKHEKVNC